MLRWHINNNVIEKLYYHEENIINPWGFETADSSAFFSLEKGVGYRHQKLSEVYSTSDQTYNARITTQMKEGKWELEIADHIQDNTIIRKAEVVTLEKSVFMDFVMRYRFKKEFIKYAEIAGHRYYHRNTNVYYQYPVDHVFLKGKYFDIKIAVVDAIVPPKMKPVMYVRDHQDEWVVHARMIPCAWDKEVIKLCTAWAGTRPLPQWMSKPILRQPFVKKSLWYRAERSPYRSKLIRYYLNPSAFGMVNVLKGDRLMWHLKMDVA